MGRDLEVRVPYPRDILAVGGAIIEDHQRVQLSRLEHERAQDLIRARGVLDQQDRQLDAVDVHTLRASEGRAHGLKPSGDDRQLDLEL